MTVNAQKSMETDYALVPAMWPFEVANALNVAVRRGRTTTEAAHRHLTLLAEVTIEITTPPRTAEIGALLDLANACNLSPYDAAYLQLAQVRGLPLATLDKKLATAATAQGIPLFQ